jgi:hypothetical protein
MHCMRVWHVHYASGVGPHNEAEPWVPDLAVGPRHQGWGFSPPLRVVESIRRRPDRTAADELHEVPAAQLNPGSRGVAGDVRGVLRTLP